jgi:integrase
MRGSLRERQPGVWQVRVCAGRSPLDSRWRYVTRTVRGGKREAQRVAAELVAEVERGLAPIARGTVGELLDQWLLHIQSQGRAASTLERYRSAVKANIVPALAHLKLAELGPADIDAFYGKLLASGLNPLTVRKCHAILSASCRQAVRWGWLDSSPHVTLPLGCSTLTDLAALRQAWARTVAPTSGAGPSCRSRRTITCR